MKTILVIEDNNEVRENIAEILELSNYRVLTAPEGKTGVETALREKPDLIVCDIMMPVLDGYGVLHLLNRHNETYGTPFIFLTAKSDKSDFRKGMEMGADDYITKPFDGIELLKAIEIRLQKNDALKSQVQLPVNQFIQTASSFSDQQLISEKNEIQSLAKKQKIYGEGRRPHSVYYVVNGKVKTYKINDDGKELITDIFSKGDFFGFTAIIEDRNYGDNADTLEETDLMLIPRDEFLSLFTNDTQVSKHFIKLITKNVFEKEETLINLAYNSLRKKVAFGLIKVLEKYRNEKADNTISELSRENLAQLIGVATESLIRTLADFKSENLISLEPSKIIILNEKKLRELPF
ncbi:MAG: response regulator [Bacteroidetes bacterium]|jgi:DNA-binding response OmpR family regulator|nr:response regulator [Bacteroidota bacterium]MBS1925319.1 response regulator [Bacteroidota bacterium]MCC6692767.1 response regulator [Chitinophagaceae bacterium]HMU48005.1 response regulator [Chitinophagaceae bacterium]